MAFAITNAQSVFANSLDIFPFSDFIRFGIMQSRIHEVWARFMASSMKDDLRYTPSDCFETFAFPEGYESRESLERAGEAYYEFRAELMVRNAEGLTKTYNRFHRPEEQSPDIRRLRELHDAMDRTVLDAYGWTELQPVCEFFPEYDDDEDDEETGSGRKRRKKFRYRWPDEIHDDVLARLLILGRERVALQADLQEAVEEEPPTFTAKRKSKASNQPKLF
jgi:hypothetical protein